jgi:hypothetical protein
VRRCRREACVRTCGAATAQGGATANTTAPDGADPADPDALPDISKFKHARDDDESQKAVPGQDPEVRREAYWREFVEQLSRSWAAPAASMTHEAVGCFHIVPEGKIVATRLTPSGDAAIDDAVRRAMTSVQSARDAHPVPVPTDQLVLIRRWICFRFTPDGLDRRARTP